MARHTYGRSRRSHRRHRRSPWRYIFGVLLILGIGYKFWPSGGSNSNAETTESRTPLAETDPVLQAVDFPPKLPTEPARGVPLPAGTPEEPNRSIPAPPIPVEVENENAGRIVQEGLALVQQNPTRLVEVRTRFNDLMLEPMAEYQRELVRQAMSQLAEKWLFDRRVCADDPLCGTYQVQSGDQFRRIGMKHSVPYEILMKINGIADPMDLKAGAQIKVVHGPFHAKVNRTTFTLDLYLQQTLVKSYRVGLGAPGQETPTGTWLVKPGQKLIQPPWPDPVSGRYFTKDDPDYPLGSRWIALQGIVGEAVGRTGFAIHGTKDPETIGTQSSQGCIRLYNGDVIEVYSMLLDGVSHVKVFD